MNKKVLLFFFVLLLLVGTTFSALAFVSVVKAEERAFTLPWSVIGSGGTAGVYTIHSTLGQPVAGSLDGSSFHLTSGFWTEVFESISEFFNFLPLILR
jgi:hypothetical protein